MDLETARWLVSPGGRAVLGGVATYRADTELAEQARLRAGGLTPARAAAVLAQAGLRARGVDKFGTAAAGLLLTADALQQATRPELAARHARRFVEAGIATVLDLGCGIGSDALAFAAAGLAVEAAEADPVTAVLAGANLARWPAARARRARAEDVTLPDGAAGRHTGVWVDPARRVPGVADVRGRARRTVALADLAPPWSFVLDVAARVPATGAKLAPGLPHAAVPEGVEAQWTSWRGEVLECTVWWGPLARVVGRTAAVCRPGAPEAVVTAADLRGSAPLGGLAEIGPWLWEADRAVVRAGLSGALPGRELSMASGYSTGELAQDLPWARRYAVIEAMPLRVKALRAWLRRRGIGAVTVKKRAASLDAEALRRALRGPGEQRATLVVTSVAGRVAALVVAPEGADATGW